MTDQKHNSICEGGKLHGKAFQYSGQSEAHSFNNGRYVKDDKVNGDNLIIWKWEPNQTPADAIREKQLDRARDVQEEMNNSRP